jgi:hypothetical protein
MLLRLLAPVVFALALVAPPATGWGQPPEKIQPTPGFAWDQAKVTVLTRQLADSVAALRREFAKQPAPALGSNESRTYLTVGDDLRLIESESRELAARIAKGVSRDESFPMYDRLRIMIRDARMDALQQVLLPSVWDKRALVRANLIELDAYYNGPATP